MKSMKRFFRLSAHQPLNAIFRRTAGCLGAAALVVLAGAAVAQSPAPDTTLQPSGTHMTVPEGYSSHQTMDVGGHIASITGSNAMYSTLVNQQSGPRILNQTFQMHAQPGSKHGLVDSLSAMSAGLGGDPAAFAKLDFSKGKFYEFSGLFRRNRQYFDYDLLGNPNIGTGHSIAIGSSAAPTGALAWPQIEQSPEMFNTVRRMTDTNITILPLSKVSYRAGYSQNIFQGPSLSPSGYQVAGSYSMLLREYQRNSTDDFMGAIDWKPVKGTRLTFEEQVDHYKGDSYFTLAPSEFLVQEPDGTKAALLISFDSQSPYKISACNTSSMMNSTTILYAPQSTGGLPVIDPACAAALSYSRTQPTRMIFPTEIFRLQSTSIRNLTMNGNVRYTNANMSLPNYYDNFTGLSGANRSITYLGSASAKRQVIAADYGITWQATKTFSLSDQVSYSNAHQPGSSVMTSGTTVKVPTTAGDETINYPTLTTTTAAAGASTFEGSAAIGTPLPAYFGQRFFDNNLTATWEATPRSTFSLTYRYGQHVIAQGIPHDQTLDADGNGTVTINESGGIFNAALRPASNWEINGSVEILYDDNVFTSVGPRQTQHYRMHTMYRPKPWAVVSGSYNDRERHNNTANNEAEIASGDATYYGPLDHVDHSRSATVSADLMPNERYGFDLSYGYSDVYTATNICYTSGASATQAGTATLTSSGAPDICPGIYARGSTTTLVDWYARDFMDAPTQFGSVALTLEPVKNVHTNLGYTVSAVDGSQFFTDARAVNGSLTSTYQSPFVKLDWKLRPGLSWKAEYNFYGYGEGGASGAEYCSTSTTLTATIVPCADMSLPTGRNAATSAGYTAPRNFHANNVTLAIHYEF